MMKHSKQRDAILAELCARHDHPTADEIYSALKEKMPTLSLGTVYRNLALLANEGCIRKLRCDNADRFDGNTMAHYHLLCRKCNRLYDLHLSVQEDLNRLAQGDFGGTVEAHDLMFYGICESCSAQSE